MKDKKLKTKIFSVSGMHCPSCEILIEKKLLDIDNVQAVDANTGQGEVEISYYGSLSLAKINELIKEDGYEISKEKQDGEKFAACSIGAGNQPASYLEIIGAVILVSVAFIFLTRSPLASSVMVSSSSALPAFFLFGLISGASSCAVLVGGLVLSMSKQWSQISGKNQSLIQRFKPHLMLNLGRLIGFGFLGGILGAIGGQVFQLSVEVSAVITILISILMLVLGLQMLGVKVFQKFQLRLPKPFLHYITDESNFKGQMKPLILGALTFFIPCGFTLTVQSLALVSGGFFQGMLKTAAFSLGTAPVLLLIGFSSVKFISKPHISDKFLKIGGLLVLIFAVYNFNSQLNVLGAASLNDLSFGKSSSAQIETKDLPPIVNGKQVIEMEAKSYAYVPNEFTVREDIPVRWEIKDAGISGCTNALIAKGLFDEEVPLDKDINVKEFTPTETGNYKFSCWMGMVTGLIRVVDEEGSVGENTVPSGSTGTCGGECTGSCGGTCGNSNCQAR